MGPDQHPTRVRGPYGSLRTATPQCWGWRHTVSSQLCPVLEHQLLKAALMKTLQMSVAFWNLFSFPFCGTQRGLGDVVLSSRHYFLAFFILFFPTNSACTLGKGCIALCTQQLRSARCSCCGFVFPSVRIEGSTPRCSTGGMHHRNSFSPMSCSRKTCPRLLKFQL